MLQIYAAEPAYANDANDAAYANAPALQMRNLGNCKQLYATISNTRGAPCEYY